MLETGYNLDELLVVSKNQQEAVSVCINSLVRIGEILEKDHLHTSEILFCLKTAKDALLKSELILKKNPHPASTRKWIETRRQGLRIKGGR